MELFIAVTILAIFAVSAVVFGADTSTIGQLRNQSPERDRAHLPE